MICSFLRHPSFLLPSESSQYHYCKFLNSPCWLLKEPLSPPQTLCSDIYLKRRKPTPPLIPILKSFPTVLKLELLFWHFIPCRFSFLSSDYILHSLIQVRHLLSALLLYLYLELKGSRHSLLNNNLSLWTPSLKITSHLSSLILLPELLTFHLDFKVFSMTTFNINEMEAFAHSFASFCLCFWISQVLPQNHTEKQSLSHFFPFIIPWHFHFQSRVYSSMIHLSKTHLIEVNCIDR